MLVIFMQRYNKQVNKLGLIKKIRENYLKYSCSPVSPMSDAICCAKYWDKVYVLRWVFSIFAQNKTILILKRESMKRVIYFLLLSFLFSCNQPPQKSPGEVAVQLFTAITSGDNLFVKENIYISDEVQREVFENTIDIAVNSKQYKDKTAGFIPSYTIEREVVNEDNAEVVISGIGPLGQKMVITVKLLLIDGAWKVDGDHGVWH